MYNPKSSIATEFINHDEILETLEYAKKNKDNLELINSLLERATDYKGLSHREAAVLLDGQTPVTVEAMKTLLPALHALGPEWVMLKGGNLPESASKDSIDFLYGEGTVMKLAAPRIRTGNVHGTGCTLSAAIAAFMTRLPIPESVKKAKDYLTKALAESDRLDVGHGHGPVHHFHAIWK